MLKRLKVFLRSKMVAPIQNVSSSWLHLSVFGAWSLQDSWFLSQSSWFQIPSVSLSFHVAVKFRLCDWLVLKTAISVAHSCWKVPLSDCWEQLFHQFWFTLSIIKSSNQLTRHWLVKTYHWLHLTSLIQLWSVFCLLSVFVSDRLDQGFQCADSWKSKANLILKNTKKWDALEA